MRRAIISIIIVLSLLSVNSTTTAPLDVSTLMNPDIPFSENTLMADIQSSGSNVPAVQYMDRIVTSQVLAISNSFASPDTHSSSIDLSSYQLPGWTLYQVQIDSDNITAITEREVIGVAKDHDLFKIEEYSDVNNWRYNSLTQGFYVMPHDGQLLNYSFYYDSPIYTPVQHGWAYYSILSDYQNSSSNLVAYTQLPTRVISGAGWENVTVSSIDLSANTEYYAVINGSALIETTFYPDIRWTAETAAGTFTTQQYDSRFSLWGSFPSEALLNYTYIPWNRTAAAALVFSNPNSISLNISGTPVSGSTWTVTSASNITTLQFSSNQSVNVFHNLILRYQKDVTADTLWKGVSSSDIMWNVTIDLSYPVVPETVVRYMNITNIPLDWVATGLYLGSSPGGSYSKSGSNVTCNMLSDGTWTLTSTAPNYAVDLSLYDSSDDSSISYMVANTVIIDANATIEDGVGTPQTGGTANLSILQSSTLIYSPAEIPASSGATDFQWDISATTNGNSTHSVEVYWISTDGLEAGYVTQEIFIYHSTNLVADDVSIEAFTEDVSAFSIGINFDKISPAQGLDDIPADVTYSFGSTVNASLTDDGGGRWTQVVNTTGMSNGVHLLTVYAEGFALENQSLVISVYLEHQTQALNWSWSNTNNITYTNSTKLSISYMELDNTPIDLAMVNVTVEGVPFDMTWDPVNETYWIELTGENFTGEGTYTLNVSAWKFGYEWQFQEINITIRSETTGLSFDVVYNPVSLNISYIESLFIQVTYDFNSVPIQSNTAVWITFNGSSQVDLVFNTTSAKWETILLGSNYLGGWDILIRASADGYSTRTNTTEFTVYEDTPLLSSDWISDSETTDYATNEPLTITLTDSTGTPITDATVSFTAFGTLYTSSSGPSGQYSFSIDPTETRGVETFVVSVVRTGFVSSQINLNLTVEATTSLQFQNLLSSEFEQWNLTIEVRYMDTFYSSAIENATVAVNLDGVDYILQYSSAAEVYMIEITLDLNPGDYTIYVSAFAEYAAYATNQAAFSVNAKEYVYLEVTFDGNLIAGQFMEI
ncbi:MAG: carboxypeptidase-like regulatory domain-containing protein, partial [Candidatus Sifarchaeia archaeon]